MAQGQKWGGPVCAGGRGSLLVSIWKDPGVSHRGWGDRRGDSGRLQALPMLRPRVPPPAAVIGHHPLGPCQRVLSPAPLGARGHLLPTRHTSSLVPFGEGKHQLKCSSPPRHLAPAFLCRAEN